MADMFPALAQNDEVSFSFIINEEEIEGGRDLRMVISDGDEIVVFPLGEIPQEKCDTVITRTYQLSHSVPVFWKLSGIAGESAVRVSTSDGDFTWSWDPATAETVKTDKVTLTISTIPGVTPKGKYDVNVQVSEDGETWTDKATLTFDTESGGTSHRSSGGGCDAGIAGGLTLLALAGLSLLRRGK